MSKDSGSVSAVEDGLPDRILPTAALAVKERSLHGNMWKFSEISKGIRVFLALVIVFSVVTANTAHVATVYSEDDPQELSGTGEPVQTETFAPEENNTETETDTKTNTDDPPSDETENPDPDGTEEPTEELRTELPTEEPTKLPDYAEDGTQYLKCNDSAAVSLGGTWIAEEKTIEDYNGYDGSPAEKGFAFTVPGMLYNGGGALLLERSFYIAGFDPEASSVVLKVKRAFYGAKIYVNGIFAAEIPFSYVQGETIDISGLVQDGKNSLHIMLTSGENSVYGAGEGMGIDGDVILESRHALSVDRILIDAVDDQGKVSMRVRLTAAEGAVIEDNVTVNVYELGIFDNGEPALHNGAGTDTQRIVTDGVQETYEVVLDVRLRNFDKNKMWSPGNPFVYEANITVGNIAETVLFTVRSVEVKEGDVYLSLNGSQVFLTGITLDGGMLPRLGLTGEKEIRTYIDYLKGLGVNTVKGKGLVFSPVWYRICDEEGVFLLSEYPLGTSAEGKPYGTDAKAFAADMAAAAADCYNYASCIVWDLAGEDAAVTGLDEAIEKIRDLELATRPFSAGLSRPSAPGFVAECDVSYLGGELFMEDLAEENPLLHSRKDLDWNIKNVAAARIITMMCGSILPRGADLYSLGNTDEWWKTTRAAFGDDSEESFSRTVRELIEYWRTTRKYGGIILPCEIVEAGAGLVSTSSEKVVSMFRGDFEEVLRNAFNGIGLNIESYISKGGRGDSLALDVAVTNNNGYDLDTIEVLFTLTQDQKVIFQETKQYDSLKKLGTEGRDVERHKFTFDVPKSLKDGAELVLTAAISVNGASFSSVRTALIEGGNTYESPYSGTAVAIAVVSAGSLILVAATVSLARIRAFNAKQKKQEKK